METWSIMVRPSTRPLGGRHRMKSTRRTRNQSLHPEPRGEASRVEARTISVVNLPDHLRSPPMPPLPLTLAISEYDHVRDLVSGRFNAKGIDLTALLLPIEEIFYRFMVYRE